MYKSIRFIEKHSALFVILSVVLLVLGVLMTQSGVAQYVYALSIAVLLSLFYLYIRNSRLSNELRKREREIVLYKDLLREENYCMHLDKHFKITYVNQKVCDFFEMAQEEIVNKPLLQFVRLEDYPEKIESLIEESGQYHSSGSHLLNGEHIDIDVSILQKGHGKEYYYLVLKRVEEKQSSAEEIKEALFKDSITHLPTRLKLFHDIEQHNENALFPKSTLIYLTIDNFDTLNEFFGIDAGSIILKRVAEWLQEDLPVPQAKLYKIDFDHFAIFVPKYLNQEHLETYLRKLISGISREEFSFEGSIFNLEVTAGVSRGSENLPKNAYLALKEAEKLKKSYKIYDEKENHHERFLHNIKINKMVKEAISHQRVEPFFQPIFNLKTNKVEKYESLMRIRQQDDSIATPGEFMEIAKTSKLYTELSREMIKKCFQQLDNVLYPITINITVEDILEPRVAQFILRNLKKNGFGAYITFEIVESESIDNEIRVKNFIKKVKGFGCKIAIDDFGSGFSNFGQLMSLEADYIKIDGSLIKNITRDKESEIMTRTIISMAKELNMKTVAEYVSNRAIFDKVKLLGIDYAQGYFIDRADPVLLKQITTHKTER